MAYNELNFLFGSDVSGIVLDFLYPDVEEIKAKKKRVLEILIIHFGIGKFNMRNKRMYPVKYYCCQHQSRRLID